MVHQFQMNGQRIALDSASGAVHVLSELAYEVLHYIELPMAEECPVSLRYSLAKYESESVAQAYAELYELYCGGTLFSEDFEPDGKAAPSGIVKAMCLHIAHDCNMRCQYCFAGTGSFDRERSLMSVETGKRAIDFLMQKSGAVKNLEIDFFGGEPLMNFDTVKQLVAYGRAAEKTHGKHIRFTITTNGTLLDDEKIDFINAEMSNVVLSIDGMKSTNDSMRFFEDGSGTYDVIMPKCKQLVAQRGDKDYYVRGTFTSQNLHFCDDVLHLADEGFDQVSMEPVVLDDGSELSLREEHLPVIFMEYKKLAKAIVKRTREGRPFNFFHFMVDLDAGPCVYKRIKGCGSGSEYIAVTPDGDIYPCHQFVEYTHYKMGNVYTGEFDRTIQKSFGGNTILSMDHCKSCWAKYFCGGGCAANNYKFTGHTDQPYKIACELEKKRVECALMIKAALAE